MRSDETFLEVGRKFLEHKEFDRVYDPVKAHEYYIKNRELKPRSNITDQQKEDIKNARELAYKIASSEQKKLFSIPAKQWTKAQANLMIPLFNDAAKSVSKIRANQRPDFEKGAPKSAVTVKQVKKDNSSVIDKGKSWLANKFGNMVSIKYTGPKELKIGNLVTIKRDGSKVVPTSLTKTGKSFIDNLLKFKAEKDKIVTAKMRNWMGMPAKPRVKIPVLKTDPGHREWEQLLKRSLRNT